MKRFLITLYALLCCCIAYAQYAGDRHQYVEYLVSLNHPDRTYKTGEEAIVTIQAQKGGIPLDGVEVRYSVGGEMVLPAPNQKTKFKQGVATISMGTVSEAGFRECDFEFDVFGKTYKDVVKVGYNIADIRPYTVMPKDFQKFWQQEIKKARQVPLDAHLTRMPQYCDNEVEVFLVRLTVGENDKCFYGYLSKPKDSSLFTIHSSLKKHPVMFCPPGAGPYKRSPQPDFARKGFIVLNVDIHGHNPELPKEYFDGVWNTTFDYWNRGLDSRDSCYYRQVYAGCVRCVDFLCSLPEWDKKNVVCKDGSQGGALSIVTAALHEKASLVCAAYPALCDLTGFAHGRAGGWPKYFFKDSPERRPTDKVLTIDDKAEIETLQYFDVVNFARILKAPGYYYFGFNDNFCSPTSIFGMFNEMKAPHTVVNTYTNGHFNYPESEAKAGDWVMQHVLTKQNPSIVFGTPIDAENVMEQARKVAKTAEVKTLQTWDEGRDKKCAYYFEDAKEDMPIRVCVPKSWDGKRKLPLVMFLHGGWNDESSYLDQHDKLLVRLADEHGYILVSPLGAHSSYGNRMVLPAEFGKDKDIEEILAKRSTPQMMQEQELSEQDVINVLEIVLKNYPIERNRMFLCGHSMGSGGTWYLGAKYADYWRALRPCRDPSSPATAILGSA